MMKAKHVVIILILAIAAFAVYNWYTSQTGENVNNPIKEIFNQEKTATSFTKNSSGYAETLDGQIYFKMDDGVVSVKTRSSMQYIIINVDLIGSNGGVIRTVSRRFENATASNQYDFDITTQLSFVELFQVDGYKMNSITYKKQ